MSFNPMLVNFPSPVPATMATRCGCMEDDEFILRAAEHYGASEIVKLRYIIARFDVGEITDAGRLQLPNHTHSLWPKAQLTPKEVWTAPNSPSLPNVHSASHTFTPRPKVRLIKPPPNYYRHTDTGSATARGRSSLPSSKHLLPPLAESAALPQAQ